MSGQSVKSALHEVVEHWRKNCLEEPPSKTREELQTDARTFFRYISSNTQVVTNSNVVLQTKSSHAEALALLIQELGAAFTDKNHSSRLRALYVLTGAMEGCKTTRLDNKILELLGKFLLQHCGPIDVEEEDYEDYDTLIRDIALQALSSLLATPSSAKDEEEKIQTLLFRMETARTGVYRRCAAADTEESTDPYGFAPTNQDIRGGLSTMPRSKRAMCFDLLQCAVSSTSAVGKEMEFPLAGSFLHNLQRQMVEYARFVANCLHGESDPRCLQQLLRLIYSLQVAFKPFFVECKSHDTLFPIESIFDAVAPYFPIQFTPPPNDIHGITREGLHGALVSVLTFTAMDEAVSKFNSQRMTTLSAELFIEQLLPEDETPGPLDKLEAVDCLSRLLLPESGKSPCDQLDTHTIQSLSEALKKTHDEASLGVSAGGQSGSENKILADRSRTLVAKIAYQLELCSNTALWDGFVTQTLQAIAPKIKASPSNTKASIAYVACLASSGGPRTLRSCLSMGLEPLLVFLDENMDDNEDTAAAVTGIGAFLSSCRVAVDRASSNGVTLHPHPLQSYCDKVAKVLLDAFEDVNNMLSPSIKVASVRALECLFYGASIDQAAEETLERLCTFLERLSRVVTVPSGLGISFTDTCSNVLGHILGSSLNAEDSSARNTLLHNMKLEGIMKEKVYPSLLKLIEPQRDSTMGKHHLKVLAIASSSSGEVADPVMSSCLAILSTALAEQGIESAIAPAEAVSHLLRHGGDAVIRAYHRSPLVDSIMDSFDKYANARGKPELRISILKLSLPETEEQTQKLENELQAARKIVNCLLPAYKRLIPRERLAKLMKIVSDALPPLSPVDNFKVCTWLPVLGASLHSPPGEESHLDDATAASEVEELARAMLPLLADFATSTFSNVEARSSAFTCLHALVAKSDSSKECPVVPIVRSNISPTLCTTIDATTAHNSLNILALLGSAAATRGGSSAASGDQIAHFLLQVACHGKSQLPFSTEHSEIFDCETFEDEKMLTLSAASAYGSMIAFSAPKPLTKQRLTYASFKYMKSEQKRETNEIPGDSATMASRVGLLAVASHVVCSCDIGKFERSTVHQMALIVIEGLSSSLFQPSEGKSQTPNTAAKNLVLSAVLKLLCLAKDAMDGRILSLVTGLLRAYAVSDPSLEVSCKLLALQGLEAVAQLSNAKSSIPSIRPAVVAVLAAALNHPSGLLRQAAVEVRNAWYVLD